MYETFPETEKEHFEYSRVDIAELPQSKVDEIFGWNIFSSMLKNKRNQNSFHMTKAFCTNKLHSLDFFWQTNLLKTWHTSPQCFPDKKHSFLKIFISISLKNNLRTLKIRIEKEVKLWILGWSNSKCYFLCCPQILIFIDIFGIPDELGYWLCLQLWLRWLMLSFLWLRASWAQWETCYSKEM